MTETEEQQLAGRMMATQAIVFRLAWAAVLRTSDPSAVVDLLTQALEQDMQAWADNPEIPPEAGRSAVGTIWDLRGALHKHLQESEPEARPPGSKGNA